MMENDNGDSQRHLQSQRTKMIPRSPQIYPSQIIMMTKKHGVHECSTIRRAEEYNYPSSKEATTIVQGNILCGHSGDHAVTTMNAVHDCAPRRAAIELNHEAVTLLRFGTEEGKALEIFKCALRLLKTQLVSSSEAPRGGGGRGRPSAQGWINHNDKDPRVGILRSQQT